MRFSARIMAVVVALAPAGVPAEPFLMRDARALAPWTFFVEAGGWWGSSRGGYDQQGNLLSFGSTPGVALASGLSGTVRAGLPHALEAGFSGSFLRQEVKLDRTDAAGDWDGADVYVGEGEGDRLLTLKWTALSGVDSAVALEAGIKMPTARGPERAHNRYERLGDGAWEYPIGARMTHSQGVICVYLEGFWQGAASRRVTEWYGTSLPEPTLYKPGQSYWFSAGAEIGTPHFSWALEISRQVTERDKGGFDWAVVPPGNDSGLEPRRESIMVAPSIILPATKSTEIRLAVLLPLEGRGVYQVFTAALSVRRYF